MINKRMEEKLASGECIDVNTIGEPVLFEPGGVPVIWELREFHEGKDYCDAYLEKWVWSIGRNKASGKIYAALDVRYSALDQFECIWLR